MLENSCVAGSIVLTVYGRARTPRLRLEARRVFYELDIDKSGILTAMELKTGLRRMGVPFITNAGVMRIIEEFDDDGDLGINETEFVEHYGKLYEQRDSNIVGKIIQYLVFHPPDRVNVSRSQRFVDRFRYVIVGTSSSSRIFGSCQ